MPYGPSLSTFRRLVIRVSLETRPLTYLRLWLDLPSKRGQLVIGHAHVSFVGLNTVVIVSIWWCTSRSHRESRSLCLSNGFELTLYQ